MAGFRRSAGDCAIVLISLLTSAVHAGQPTKTGTPGKFELVGDSGVSAQQLFLGANNKVRLEPKALDSRLTPSTGLYYR